MCVWLPEVERSSMLRLGCLDKKWQPYDTYYRYFSTSRQALYHGFFGSATKKPITGSFLFWLSNNLDKTGTTYHVKRLPSYESQPTFPHYPVSDVAPYNTEQNPYNWTKSHRYNHLQPVIPFAIHSKSVLLSFFPSHSPFLSFPLIHTPEKHKRLSTVKKTPFMLIFLLSIFYS